MWYNQVPVLVKNNNTTLEDAIITFWISIEKKNGTSLFKQIYVQLRNKILQGELKAGEKLPATRELAAELHVSRTVVLEAYNQLIAEGYLESSAGSGTYIAAGAQSPNFVDCSYPLDEEQRVSSSNGAMIDFRTGVPALDQFPIQAIKREIQNVVLRSPMALWSYGESAGYAELRNNLSLYLYKMRGVYCKPDQIVITSGTVQALAILADLLLEPGDGVVIEDPVCVQIQDMFLSKKAVLYPVPVDQAGMQTQYLEEALDPKIIFTSPSHQFPLGSVLSIQRRLELIEYARRKNCYILEDDYDSEFRYSCAPINSMQCLDPEHVVYIGTFSKTLLPAIRTGYMVAPEPLVAGCREQKLLADRHSPLLQQYLMSNLIANGFLQRHISKMRKIYPKRQKVFIDALKAKFPQVGITGESAGYHIVAAFPGVEFTEDLVRAIKEKGVLVYPVEEHAIVKGRHLDKLMFGYLNLSQKQIEKGLNKIKSAIEEKARGV